MNYEEMIKLAEKASENAYVPYSKFPVGACVLTDSGKVYTGCNFENSSFGLTIIADGEKKVRAVAIFSPKMDNCTPCGACRQVLNEFKSQEGLDVITKVADGIKVCSIEELLPESFTL